MCVVLAGIPALMVGGCSGSPIQPGPGPIVQPPPPPPPPPPGPAPVLRITKILTFGDSMTEGVDSPPFALTVDDWRLPLSPGRSQSYPFKLKALLDGRYTSQSLAVYNGGRAGRSAREDVGRFSQALSEASRPELVLLMEGANDFNSPLGVGEGINARVRAVVDALEDMVREASGRGIPVMVATLPPQRLNSPKGGGTDFVPRFNELVRIMAANKGAQVVDIGSLPLSIIGQDGLHPTEAGYARIAELWFEAIRARFEQAQ
jgi:lysophospholipase L1-like esterase